MHKIVLRSFEVSNNSGYIYPPKNNVPHNQAPGWNWMSRKINDGVEY